MGPMLRISRSGDLLVPGIDARHGEDNDVIWVADNAWDASKYGHCCYQVEPLSEPKMRGKAHEFYTTGATVFRDVPNSKIIEDANRQVGQ